MINKPASFTLRVLAYITECCFALFLTMICMLFVVSQPTLTSAMFVLSLVCILYFLNPIIIYNSTLLTYYFGGSFGKLLTGLQVTNETGAPLGFKRIAFRQTIGYMFSGLLFGLGFFSLIKDEKKQAWHDKAVGSLVVVQQQLWPLALLVCVITLAGSIYLGGLAWERVMAGSLPNEVQGLTGQFMAFLEEAEAKK